MSCCCSFGATSPNGSTNFVGAMTTRQKIPVRIWLALFVVALWNKSLVSAFQVSIHQPVSLSSLSSPPSVSSRLLALLSKRRNPQRRLPTSLQTKTDSGNEQDMAIDIDAATQRMQWELLQKYHAQVAGGGGVQSDDGNSANQSDDNDITTSWKGIWTTYDYMGDVLMETAASVNYQSLAGDDIDTNAAVAVSHTIVTGAVKSDCVTCFDSVDTKTIPVATYTPSTLESRNVRLGACGMVIGPAVLKSGAMATELVLSHEVSNSRIRVIFQHAPVWEKGIEPGSMPPQGLKLFRCLVARERCHVDAPPTRQSEQLSSLDDTIPLLYRTVPPIDWQKKWGGTSWTWGPDAGHRGWSISELSIGDDDWHGSAPVEVWNLRLPGGIFVQTPRVIPSNVALPCRLAWLVDKDTLLRLEGSVLALQPIFIDSDDPSDENEQLLAGFEPPTLASLRCDVLQNLGDLEGVAPSFVQDEIAERSAALDETATSGQKAVAAAVASSLESANTAATAAKPEASSVPTTKADKDDDAMDMQSIQDALQL